MNEWFKELDKAHWLIRVLVFGGYIFYAKFVFSIIVDTLQIIKKKRRG